MGRRGYVQKRQAEHDINMCISAWAQSSAVAYMEGKGLDVYTGNSSGMEDPGSSDSWEIAIPMKRTGRGNNVRYVHDVAKMDRIIADLRKHPGKVKSDDGDGGYGDQLADILESGMKAAEKRGYDWIVVDFW